MLFTVERGLWRFLCTDTHCVLQEHRLEQAVPLCLSLPLCVSIPFSNSRPHVRLPSHPCHSHLVSCQPLLLQTCLGLEIRTGWLFNSQDVSRQGEGAACLAHNTPAWNIPRVASLWNRGRQGSQGLGLGWARTSGTTRVPGPGCPPVACQHVGPEQGRRPSQP